MDWQALFNLIEIIKHRPQIKRIIKKTLFMDVLSAHEYF
jgi:hypothetical protein